MTYSMQKGTTLFLPGLNWISWIWIKINPHIQPYDWQYLIFMQTIICKETDNYGWITNRITSSLKIQKYQCILSHLFLLNWPSIKQRKMTNGVSKVLNMRIRSLNGITFHFNMGLLWKLKLDTATQRSISNSRILRSQIITWRRRTISPLSN